MDIHHHFSGLENETVVDISDCFIPDTLRHPDTQCISLWLLGSAL
jgi:hypothetical protein